MLLRMDGVVRNFGSRTLFRDVALTLYRNDRIGLIGPNGAGKTTLMRMVAGDEIPDAGRITSPRGVRVGMLRQEIDPNRSCSVREEVSSVFAELDALEVELSELEHRMTELANAGREVPPEIENRYGDCRTSFELGGGFEREARVERILAGLGFDSERAGRPLHSFSGGWLMRVELAKLLLSTPDVLLLDEPTNHLDLPSIKWFEETLTDYPGAVVIISHDRTFLHRHVNRVAELESGALTLFEGNLARYISQKKLRQEELLARKKTQDRQIAETHRFIDRFRAKASKAKQVQSRVKALDKIERVEIAGGQQRRMRLKIPSVVRSGDSVLRLEEIHKSYGDTLVYRGVDLSIRRGDRVALVGPNGAGKSTLLRIAAGVLAIDQGEREIGHNVQLAFYAQHQLEVLDPDRSVLSELESAARTDDISRLRGHLGAFLFSGDDVEKKVSVLSGGEKARLALAKLLLHPANFLILDEPTNHLDMTSREVLEEALTEYGGTLLVISHDRTFLNALVNRVVEVEAGCLAEFTGNYDDYLRRVATPSTNEPVSLAPAVPNDAVPEKVQPLTKRERIAMREQVKQIKRRHERAVKRLAAVENEIRGLEERLEQLSWRLGDPSIQRDGDAIRELEAERSETRSKVDELYREWERLAAEIDSGKQVTH